MGWKVYRVPETATILQNGGVVFRELSEAQAYEFQKGIVTTILSIENTFVNLAKLNAERGNKTVVICDRGAMDPSAYMGRPEWLRLLDELNLDEVDIRDNRYDCVVHLVSAAKGAEPFYTLENNRIRSEGIDLARKVDEIVMKAWIGHPSLQVIDNSSVDNFAQKCDRAVQAVMTRLGLVADSERYGKHVRRHKFLVKSFSLDASFPVVFRDFNVEHVYLSNTAGDGVQIRIRKREEIGSSKEVHRSMTIRYPEVDGQRVETRRNLSFREYEALRAQADPTRSPITKRRRCFLFQDRYFQIDVYRNPHEGLVLLEAYLDYETPGTPVVTDARASLPDWLELEEVTDDKSYSMFTLAKVPGGLSRGPSRVMEES
ncbi:hypothetical protein HK097_007674 [Rhizophlyctis rosea]|uniref:NadR/Ttd14 AAA domain-containing protein n=1 Tax=Rhizophlyctis rosea TaxID=64517 RepID=A0AAD5X1H7_9FUNG|nr:hypothetical protein HK097_007674 [Rhizophlyctis rosea]